MGLWEGSCVWIIRELVCQPCVKEYRLLSSSPDVGTAIPKHNYLWTSGTCRQCQGASKRALSLFLCPLLSLNHCLLSQDHSFLLVGIAFFIFPPTYSFVFVLPSSSRLLPPPCRVAVISFPAALFRCQKECISPSFVSLLVPPASAHMFAIRPIVSFLLQFVTTLLSLRPSALSPSFSCCLDLSFLLTLVKTSPPPRAVTTAEPICYSNPFFFPSQEIVTCCVHVLHIPGINNHANDCIHSKRSHKLLVEWLMKY